MSLIAKFIFWVSILLLAVMAPFAYLNLEAMREILHEAAVSEADNISETIIKTTHYQMLENDRKRVYQMIQEAGKQHGIDHIRMITKDGHIIFSTNRAEIGTNLDKTAAACDMCHAGTRPLTDVSSMNRSRVFRNPDGEEVLGITKAIYNQPSCSAAECHFHPPDQDILGVLDTAVSLQRVRVQTRKYEQRLLALTLAMLVAAGVSLTLLVRSLVTRPIRDILRHTRKVGELHLGEQLSVNSDDEIGHLASSFNVMTTNLKTAQDELQNWAKTLETKVESRTEELQRMQAQLIRSEKLASLGEIVAGIAHELNNPLTGVLVLASLLEQEGKLDPELRDDIATIVHETKRCARIVKGLLEFSRETTPQKAPSDLTQTMEKSLALIGTQSIFHDVRIERDYQEGLPPALVDPHQIEQVFINILLNAAQSMAGGGTLTLTTRAAAQELRVSIADTGSGIPPEHLGRIFDPFFTTKEHGTGLGLAVSYGIVETHGGRIEVDSIKGKGTTFTICLPISADTPPGAGDAPAPA
ncbi:MAG: sensor histidine kinase [Deferrisomatales bacterium]